MEKFRRRINSFSHSISRSESCKSLSVENQTDKETENTKKTKISKISSKLILPTKIKRKESESKVCQFYFN